MLQRTFQGSTGPAETRMRHFPFVQWFKQTIVAIIQKASFVVPFPVDHDTEIVNEKGLPNVLGKAVVGHGGQLGATKAKDLGARVCHANNAGS